MLEAAAKDSKQAKSGCDAVLTSGIEIIGKAIKRSRKIDKLAVENFHNQFADIVTNLQDELDDSRKAIKHAIINSTVL